MKTDSLTSASVDLVKYILQTADVRVKDKELLPSTKAIFLALSTSCGLYKAAEKIEELVTSKFPEERGKLKECIERSKDEIDQFWDEIIDQVLMETHLTLD